MTRDRLAVKNLTVRYGALQAVRDVTVAFEPDSIVGLIGPNGAGKTTLLNALSGFTHISSGTIHLGGRDLTRLPAQSRVALGIVRSFQTVRLMEDESVFLNVALGCERYPQPTVLEQIMNLPRQWRARRRDRDATYRILDTLGLSEVTGRSVSELPYATRRLVELARILVVDPEVVLLDEPAAGSDRAERDLISRTLRQLHARQPFTMIVVEHDVDVVRKLCGFAVALDSGGIVASGSPEAVLANELVQQAYFGVGHRA